MRLGLGGPCIRKVCSLSSGLVVNLLRCLGGLCRRSLSSGLVGLILCLGGLCSRRLLALSSGLGGLLLRLCNGLKSKSRDSRNLPGDYMGD